MPITLNRVRSFDTHQIHQHSCHSAIPPFYLQHQNDSNSRLETQNPSMGLPEIVEVARNFSVIIRVQGPDPKGLKMRKHAFHHYISGKTTLSASGVLLPNSFVLTVASIIEPFLSSKYKDHMSQVKPELISGAHIDIMVEGNAKGTPHWLPAELITLVDIPESSIALESLVGSSSGSLDHGWEVGWSLASYKDGHQPYFDDTQKEAQRSSQSNNPTSMEDLGTRIAILKLSTTISKDFPNLKICQQIKRGDLLITIGAPFGVLSPAHFSNSVSVGYVSNCYPSSSSHVSLLMADIRCLPGMEGSPVFGEQLEIVGMLTRPLRQRGSGAEVQLVIPWEAIVTSCTGFLSPKTIITKNPLKTRPNPIESAMSSICLITIGDGVWASGVLLNHHGLILTNAHLLEPWRFKKTPANHHHNTVPNIFFTRSSKGSKKETRFLEKESRFHEKEPRFHEKEPRFLEKDEKEPRFHEKETRFHEKDEKETRFLEKEPRFHEKETKFHEKDEKETRFHERVNVRVDYNVENRVWCDADVVYVSKGPLDVALLKLEFVPEKLQPIVMDFTCPLQGSKVYVVGHGLFGPRCDFLPSTCVGVVAKVVKTPAAAGDIPAMIETTAAVHPGGSGGAILNSNGHMISLVTSNAKHGGGTVIPHLNFSIPCAALKPIFNFSKDMKDISILKDLDKPNEHLSSVWALMPPASPELPGLPEENNIKDTKGSKFAKFIAEQQELVKQTSPLDKKDGDSSKYNITSKL
ncbi:hypothetical protein L2E82_31166 [Cichorium intybus]|uniref:Uncharacterized protein n=1 Tax=Cichorium intybus TaxID=13427 RepID=A0ACB9D2H5_CICIN|nr:hypothetical protein L2E82_31166 [Cichorium intybus]